MALHVKENNVVVPGEVIAHGMDYLPSNGTYRFGEEIRANRVGLLKVEGKVLKSIPLCGVYIPQKHDVVIGRVVDILMSGWRMNLNSPYTAVLGLKDATFDFVSKSADLTKYFDLDDYVVCKIIQVTTQNLIDVTCKGPGLKKLVGGRVFHVSPHKVPRIIGLKGSMISMIKKATSCKIIIGQNGVVWLNGDARAESLAFQLITRVESLAHVSGLTEKIRKEILELTGIDVSTIPDEPEEQEEAPARHDNDNRRDGSRPPHDRPRFNRNTHR